MASANYGKCKTAGSAKAVAKHCAEDTREKMKHSNPDIDITKTPRNRGSKYRELCDGYDSRINELDSTTNKNKRKDRVTLMTLVIPVPEDLLEDQQAEWFTSVRSVIGNHYGSDNLIGSCEHYDEIHDYYDPNTKTMKTSRPHMHLFVIPEHDGQLNCKWCSSRKNMISVNNDIHAMTQRDYGVDFMDGTQRKSKQSMTELKNESEKALIGVLLGVQQQKLDERAVMLDRVENGLRQQVDEANNELNEREKQLNIRESALNEREADLDVRDNNLRAQEENTLKNEIRAKNAYSDAEDVLTKARNILQGANDHVATMVAPPGLEEFCKTYKRRIAKTKMKDVGTALKPDYKRVYDLDKDGKKQYEEHNCYNDWQASLTAKRQSDRLTRELLDQADEMLAREKQQKSNFIDFEI